MPEQPTVAYSCPDESLLKQMLNGELPPEVDDGVARHVDSCMECQRVLDRLMEPLPDAVNQITTLTRSSEGKDALPLLEGFELLQLLDQGGMGIVYRVRDLKFGRDLALKVMKPGLSKPRFLNEAHICGRLTHPNIVPVHTDGQLKDGRPYYLMKLVEGETLSVLLRRRTTPADQLPEWIRVFADVCQAMAYAHSQGVIHRDLKPANIMVGQFREVHVMDWGLAKELTIADAEVVQPDAKRVGDTWPNARDLTRPNEAYGTYAYMAPEQALGLNERVDCRSDVFGLGAILCEILTGDPPYQAMDPAALEMQAKRSDLTATFARIEVCGADQELIQLTKHCLAQQKADRPADAGEVVKAVAAYLSRVEERQRQGQLAGERQQVRAAERRRQRQLWTALAASVAVGLLLLIFAISPWLNPEPKPGLPPHDPNKLRLGLWAYPGYAPLVVAAEMKLCDGLDLALVDVGDIKNARKKMTAREIDASVCVVDSHVHTRAQDVKAKVLLKLAPSHGADGIVARSGLTSLTDLHGKRVAYVESEPPHFLLLALADKTKEFDLSKVDWQATTAEDAAQLFINEKVDAAITWEPYLSQARDKRKGLIIASSKHVPDTIVDILTVDERYLENHPDKVEKLIRGWFNAVDVLKEGHPKREEAIGHVCRVLKLSRKEYDDLTPLSPFAGVQNNVDFFTSSGSGGSEFRTLMSAAQDRWNTLRAPTIKLNVSPVDADGSALFLRMRESLLDLHARDRPQ